jgi:hypothetical protein
VRGPAHLQQRLDQQRLHRPASHRCNSAPITAAHGRHICNNGWSNSSSISEPIILAILLQQRLHQQRLHQRWHHYLPIIVTILHQRLHQQRLYWRPNHRGGVQGLNSSP